MAAGRDFGDKGGMSHRIIGLIVALLAGAVLGSALASEYWGGLVPCPLCLWERWPYRVAILFGVLAVLMPARSGRLALWGAVVAFAAGAVLGGVHVGVEWGFWPSPLPQCGGVDLSGLSIAERLKRMPLVPAKPCDEPTFLIPGLPVSMAAMNMLAGLVLMAGTVGALRWRGGGR